MIKLNGQELTIESFPNRETRVNGEELVNLMLERNKIFFKYEDDSDLVKLMFVKKFLDDHNKTSHLTILYMPYSRMDRKEGNSVFTLKYICEFINKLNFNSVEVVEPHSDVTTALLDKSYATYPTIKLLEDVVSEVGFDKTKDYLFFPDAGAQKRYSKVKGYKQLVGHKERDFSTGRINKLEVVGNVYEQGFKVIILDDLCSYGGTFIMSAERLKELGASEIYLLVAHCEESIFEGEIFKKDVLDKVFTTNSIVAESIKTRVNSHSLKVYDIIKGDF